MLTLTEKHCISSHFIQQTSVTVNYSYISVCDTVSENDTESHVNGIIATHRIRI